MWVVIAGDFFEGIQEVVGPFWSEESALAYIDSHNMGHWTKAAVKARESVSSWPTECPLCRSKSITVMQGSTKV